MKNILNFSLGVRVTRNPNSLTSLVKSLTKTQGMVVIDLSHIPVNKCTNSRLGWTNYSDLYEIVHPSLVHISLCLLTGAECGKVGVVILFYILQKEEISSLKS